MKIWLCDLTHDQQVLASDTMPSNVGYIGAYLLSESKYNHDVKLFKYPGKLINAIEARDLPDIIGFSHFMWNARLSLAIAKEMKIIKPEIIVVFGGLNYPIEKRLQIEWLAKNDTVDFHVYKEGEIAFQHLVDTLVECNLSVGAAKEKELPGVHFLKSDGSFQGPPPAPRVSDLASFQSPYLSGIMDEFFDGRLMPLMTTNRGCPFTCTFCAEGQSYYNKVNKMTVDRVKEEIEYIGRKMSNLPADSSRRDVYITDSNFGMYKYDIEYAQAFKAAKGKYGWPEYVKATTGKNLHHRIIEVADILDGAMTLAGSVQSLDEKVLENVRRTNIDTDSLVKVAMASTSVGANSYSDVILGLPGDSLKGHMETVGKLIDAKFDYMALYQLRLQADCEMGTDEYKNKFGLKGQHRVLTRSYGSYPFEDKYLNIAEIEEVCVEGNDLPFEDYRYARDYDLTVAIFCYDKFFDGVMKLLDHYEIPRHKWLNEIFALVKNHKNIKNLYEAFGQDTIDELWESESELIEFTCERENILQYVNGDMGANLLGTYRIIAVTENIDEICDIAAEAAIKCLTEVHEDLLTDATIFVNEICLYEKERKRGLYIEDLEDTEIDVQYDIPHFLDNNEFENVSEFQFNQPRKLRFSRPDGVTDLIRRNNRIFGTNIMSRYKQWTRTPWKMVYRTAEYVNSPTNE